MVRQNCSKDQAKSHRIPYFSTRPRGACLTTRARRDMLNVSDRRSGYYVIKLKADYTGAVTGACGKPVRTDASAAGTAR